MAVNQITLDDMTYLDQSLYYEYPHFNYAHLR